jgi:6-phosphogluconolactonase
MRTFLILPLVFCLACHTTIPKSAKMTFFIGTYTQHEGHVDGKGNGIYKMTLDPETLDCQVVDTIKGMVNPSFLALSGDQTMLYAVNEISPGGVDTGRLEVYSIGEGTFGKKLFAGSTGSFAPCHVALHPKETMAVVSNYVGGKVAVFPLPLGENTQPQLLQLPSVTKKHPRQEASHPHSAIFSLDGTMVYVADLGTDRIMAYQVDASNHTLTPATVPYVELPDGSGPRHMCLAANGTILYALCELSNQVAVLEVSDKGVLTLKQQINTLPATFQGENTSADIHLASDGRHLYTSNRGHNSIAVFSVAADGALQVQGHVETKGKTPRNFHLSNDGNWLLVANQDSDDITLFSLKKPGLPEYVKSIKVNTPVAIVELR